MINEVGYSWTPKEPYTAANCPFCGYDYIYNAYQYENSEHEYKCGCLIQIIYISPIYAGHEWGRILKIIHPCLVYNDNSVDIGYV